MRKNRLVYGTAHRIRAAIPERWRCGQEYRTIIDVKRQSDAGHEEAVCRRQLTSLLKDALKNVPFYRESVDLRPSEISGDNCFGALAEFPFTDKKTVRENGDAFLNRRFEREDLVFSTSGGSTGEGISVYRTRQENTIERAFFAFHWGKLGFSFDRSRILRMGSDAMKKKDEDPCEIRGNRLYVSPNHLNDTHIGRIYRKMVAYRPRFIHSYPSCVEYLARYILEESKPPLPLEALLMGSELLTVSQLRLFKKAFTGAVSANYGLTERTNLAFFGGEPFADEIPYRVEPLYGYTENLEDEFGNQEIVGTSYWNFAMPLIRYRTQDFGPLREGDPPVFQRIDGRQHEFFITREGGSIAAMVHVVDNAVWDYVKVYQLVQRRKGAVTIRLVPKPGYGEDAQRMILEKQQERWGEFFDIDIETVADIPRTRSGKFRCVVSELP